MLLRMISYLEASGVEPLLFQFAFGGFSKPSVSRYAYLCAFVS
jgi:hypothetical protein